MSWASSRGIPAAKAIDDCQDSIANPIVRAPRDLSGALVLSMLLAIPLIGAISGVASHLYA